MWTYLNENDESCTFSPEREVVSSQASCLASVPSALSKLIPTAGKCSCNASETEYCPDSRYGMTSEPLTEILGADKLKSLRVDFLARTSHVPEMELELMEKEAVCGNTWRESFAKWDRGLCLWKIRQLWLFEDLERSLEIWPRWGTMRDGECWDAETPEGCTNAIESGYLHLPTIGKNETKGSGRNRFRNSPHFRGAKMSEGLRISESDPIYTHPRFAELMMGWPTKWSSAEPLETAKFQRWLRSHGVASEDQNKPVALPAEG